MSEWISIKDRLPEHQGEYIVCGEKATIYGHDIGDIYIDSWKEKYFMSAVLYWMPLPEPPKED